MTTLSTAASTLPTGSSATGSAEAATTTTSASSTATSEANATVALLGTLAVKGRAPKTGYDRTADFGPAWTDNVTVEGGRNGCDTRNDILRRDLVDIVLDPMTRGCTVLSGTLHDAYTGKTIRFTRGQATSGAVQIDHVVALMNAWQSGAQGISPDARVNLANDPLNLQAVDGPTNAQKGAGDAATWLPPHKAYRCTYVSRQVQVKAKYGLWVTQAEKDATLRVLSTCGASVTTPGTVPALGRSASGGSIPSGPTATSTPVTVKTTAAPQTLAPTTTVPKSTEPTTAAPKTTPAPKTTAPPPVAAGAQTFKNCTELRKVYPHGVARPGGFDKTSGKPKTGYIVDAALYEANKKSDGDNDGVACEK